MDRQAKQTDINSHVHIRSMHTYVHWHALTPKQINTQTDTYTRTLTHTNTRTLTHTHTHTYRQTHTLGRSLKLGSGGTAPRSCRVSTYGIANYSIIQEGKYVATDLITMRCLAIVNSNTANLSFLLLAIYVCLVRCS